MVRDFYHLRIVAQEQAAIAIHVFLDRRDFERATVVRDDSMATLHERCRVIGADVAVDEKQDFHLSSPAWTVLLFGSSNFCPLLPRKRPRPQHHRFDAM